MRAATAILVGAGGLAAAAGGTAVAVLARRAPDEEQIDVSGAPFGLLPKPRRSIRVGQEAHVTSPSWEPRALTALARWEPSRPAGPAGRVAASLWAGPLTLVGLGVGLASRVRPTVRDGALVFADARGAPGAVLDRWRVAAGALGHVIIARGQPSAPLLAHELVHVRHAERLGPFLAPVYLALLAVYGYARHPLERAARRAARRATHARVKEASGS